VAISQPEAHQIEVAASGGTAEVLYKTLKAREIVRGCRSSAHHPARGMAFRKRTDNANTPPHASLIPGANVPRSGLNIQGIEYSQVLDGNGVDRPNGA
jgi:hypothetical protein